MPLGLTGALLIGAAAPVAGKAVGNAIRGKKSDYDKYNIKEIGKLKRMREMDALGLTDEERRMMRSQFDRKMGGAKAPAVAKAIGSQYGITDPKEQAQFAEYIALNPQMAGPLSSSLK